MMSFRDWISYRLGSSLLSVRPFALCGADDGSDEGDGDDVDHSYAAKMGGPISKGQNLKLEALRKQAEDCSNKTWEFTWRSST
ncbi:hypothetical protein ACP70R_001994 [Stipagrostis hirtigluma subsp. patula]